MLKTPARHRRCAVCLEIISSIEKALPCGHVLHPECDLRFERCEFCPPFTLPQSPRLPISEQSKEDPWCYCLFQLSDFDRPPRSPYVILLSDSEEEELEIQ